MDLKTAQSTLKGRFKEYAEGFLKDDADLREAAALKIGHTHRVCKNIVNIGTSVGCSDDDLAVAEIAALLHDIGRFEQFRRYHTFMDHKSENHAVLGAAIIQSQGILEEVDDATATLIRSLVRDHNLAAIPDHESGRFLFFLKMLRDADKLDIWRVVTDYYHAKDALGKKRNTAIELDLPDDKEISDPIYDAVKNRAVAPIIHAKTLIDFKLLQMSWIYDVNFPFTFQSVLKNGYLEKIRDAIPYASNRIQQLYTSARKYAEEKAV